MAGRGQRDSSSAPHRASAQAKPDTFVVAAFSQALRELLVFLLVRLDVKREDS
jgi:hypothetical protein